MLKRFFLLGHVLRASQKARSTAISAPLLIKNPDRIKPGFLLIGAMAQLKRHCTFAAVIGGHKTSITMQVLFHFSIEIKGVSSIGKQRGEN